MNDLKDIQEIAENLRTQDNRCTSSPIFVVQEKVRYYGFGSGYAEGTVWVNSGQQITADERQQKILDRMVERGRNIEEWENVGYRDRWEFVTACFTEQGCKDFISRDGHNHRELRIYAYGSYRNYEFIAVRNLLIERY